MNRRIEGVLRAFAASLILFGSSHAFAQQNIAPRNNAAHSANTQYGREALDESVTRLATQEAFRINTDPQVHQQKLLGILLLLSAPPMNTRKTP